MGVRPRLVAQGDRDLTTTGTRFRRIERILDEALEREPPAREAYVSEACKGDDGLRSEIEALLAAHDRAGNFLETAAVERFRGALLAEGERVGRYRILRVLGSGGGGTVYLAEQDQPRRHVALKAMHGGFSTDTAATRFEQEAEILARLQHPSIAHVYEAGVSDSMPYIVLEYIEGGETILDFLAGRDRRAGLRLFAEVCDAVHAGHLKGVIHRDLKPQNILVLPSGRPKVIDFGIARIEQAGDALESRPAGEVAGTPPYMSPEQCTADADLDLRSDIYSLGVVLYEILCGRLPHEVSGISIAEAARRIRETPPAPADTSLPADLRAILDKAMASSPDERYSSAAMLAADVRHFLESRPVAARPAGRLHDLRLFVRRRRALSLALLALGAALVLGTALSLRFALRAESAHAAERQRSYAAGIAAAAASVHAGNPAAARPYLDAAPAELRGWEWDYLHGRLDASEQTIEVPFRDWGHAQFAFGPENALFLTRGSEPDTAYRMFDARDWSPRGAVASIPHRINASAFVGDDIVWADSDVVRRARGTRLDETVWETEVSGHTYFVRPVLGGSRILVLGGWGSSLLLDAGTGKQVAVIMEPDKDLSNSNGTTSPDGERLALARDREVMVLDLASNDNIATLPQDRVVTSLAFRADRGHLAIGFEDGSIRIVDPAARAVLTTIAGTGRAVTALAFAPDGARVVSGHPDGTIALWDIRTGRRAGTLRGHRNAIAQLMVRRDGRIISSDSDNVKIWQPAARPQPMRLGRYERMVFDIAFGPKSEQAACAVLDGSARVYDLRSGAQTAELRHEDEDERCNSVSFHPDGKRIAVSWSSHLEVWRPHDGSRVALPDPPERTFRIRWSPDGSVLVSVSREGAIVVWDSDTRVPRYRLSLEGAVQDIAFARGGELLFGHAAEHVLVWATRTGRLVRKIELDPPCSRIAVHPDGRFVAVALPDRRIRILDEEGRTVRTHAGLLSEAARMSYSPDGSRLAVSTYLGFVYLLRPDSAAPILDLRPDTGWLWAVAWSPDGRHLAAGGGTYEGLESALWLWSLRNR